MAERTAVPQTTLKFLTCKFLPELGKRRSEIHGIMMDYCAWATWIKSNSLLHFPKKQLSKEGVQYISPVAVLALKCSQDCQDIDILLRLVRAVKCYLEGTRDLRVGKKFMFIFLQIGLHQRYPVFYCLDLERKHIKN